MSAIQKRPDIFIIVCVGAYLLSENGHKPQVKAIFTALECLVFFYILKNVIYPSKNFYKNWLEKLNKIKFKTTEDTLRLVLGFLIFAYTTYYVVSYLYLKSGQ
jgi:hypothetical protein